MISLDDHGKPAQVVVDLTHVRFCDAFGLGMLNSVHRGAQEKGGTIRVVCPEGPVRRIFRLMGTTHGLRVHDTLDDVVAPTNPA